jgi:hypothetical protein
MGLALGAGSSAGQVYEQVRGLSNFTIDFTSGQVVEGAASRGSFSGPAYSNINPAPTIFTRNRILTGALAQPVGTQVVMGDNAVLAAGAAGSLVSEVSFSVVNGNGGTTGGVPNPVVNVGANEVEAVVGIWNNPGAPNTFSPLEAAPALGLFSVALPALNSLFGGTFTVSGLEGLGINVTGSVFVGVFFRDAAGDLVNRANEASFYGQLLSNQAATVGSSDGATFFRERIGDGVGPADGLFGFAPPTVSNFQFEIVTVPAPASAALLGLGGLMASRRRR